MTRKDTIWQDTQVAVEFLAGMRGAFPLAGEQMDVLLRVCQTAVPDVRHFLDLGCGDGVMARVLRTRYPDAHAVLLDFSDAMLDAARRTFDGDTNVTFVCADYSTPDWVNHVSAPFDLIVSGYSIHHQPDARKQGVYRELLALLRPGGLFLNLEHVASQAQWGEVLFDDLFIDSLLQYEQRRGSGKTRDDVAREFHERPHKDANILAPVDVQCGWLREVGYTSVDCFFKIFEMALFGGTRPQE